MEAPAKRPLEAPAGPEKPPKKFKASRPAVPRSTTERNEKWDAVVLPLGPDSIVGGPKMAKLFGIAANHYYNAVSIGFLDGVAKMNVPDPWKSMDELLAFTNREFATSQMPHNVRFEAIIILAKYYNKHYLVERYLVARYKAMAEENRALKETNRELNEELKELL